jgi:hypothetical protein
MDESLPLEQRIKEQVEYYFSDRNLERDYFYRAKIDEAENGYVDLKIVQNSKVIRKMEVKMEQMIDAVKDSTEVELSDDKTKIRRVGNKPMPPR